jgi:hypothetical protein
MPGLIIVLTSETAGVNILGPLRMIRHGQRLVRLRPCDRVQKLKWPPHLIGPVRRWRP